MGFCTGFGNSVRSGICGKTVLSGLSECLFHFIYRPCDDDFLQKIDSKAQKDAGAWQRANWKVSVGKLLVIVAACAVATLLKTDYSAMGILTIVLMYNMRKNKMYCIGIGCAVLTLLSLNEITCFLAMIPVHFYNGKRGLNLKYPFYAFYPVHLLVLFAIAAVLGMAGVAVV